MVATYNFGSVYKSIKDTPICGNLDFNCLKLKYEQSWVFG